MCQKNSPVGDEWTRVEPSSKNWDINEYRFHQISCSVSATAVRRRIVSNVSGVVKSGEVLAVMGPSGAGWILSFSLPLLCQCEFGRENFSFKGSGTKFPRKRSEGNRTCHFQWD